jgi:hypothetical protein
MCSIRDFRRPDRHDLAMHRWPLAAATAAVAALTGCGGTVDDEGGFGVPRVPADARVDAPPTEIRGTVRVEDDGCLTLETGSGQRRWIVWPSDQEDDQGQPVLDDRVVEDGDVLVGSGTELPGDALPGWMRSDGYFVSFGGFCSAEETGVVVLGDVALG